MIKIIKKDKTLQNWDSNKIRQALNKASERVSSVKNKITLVQVEQVVKGVEKIVFIEYENKVLSGTELHDLVMRVLYNINHNVYSEYRAYRNYKERFQKSFANTYEFANKVVLSGDRENANKDSQLNSTKQALISEGIMKELMCNFELKPEWLEAHQDGYIHIHDLGSRFLKSHNCCLFDMANVLKGGFNLNNTRYSEPSGVQKAFDIASDIVLSASAQQYGGFSVPNIDDIFEPYAIKTYNKALNYFLDQDIEIEKAKKLAKNQTLREIEQGVQAFETKLNTVSNSLGQTPFVTVSFALNTSEWGREISKAILNMRIKGLGTNKVTAVFPKLIFLHRKEINGEIGTCNHDLKQLAIQCCRKRLYPDFLSIDNGFLKEMYDECRFAITPMGCRAFLGEFRCPETKELIFNGRANIGAVTLNVPLLALESKGNIKKFYELTDKYIKMVWDIHLDSYEKIGKSKASTNPLYYVEGGAWKTVNSNDDISSIVEGFTASLGFIGLEETCWALFNSSLEDNLEFGTKYTQYLWDKTVEAKKKYNKLFTLYSTPAESLIERFQNINRDKFGIIYGATHREYMSNSFHQHVTKKHIPPKKMSLEKPMFDISKGGRIVYCEYPYNIDDKILEQNINFAMENGLYFGTNIESCTCQDCGKQGEFDICPECGSANITSVDRCCGYLSFKKVNGDTRYNKAKQSEIKDRVVHAEGFSRGNEENEDKIC